MTFHTPVKLFYDNKDRGTIFVHWKVDVVLDDRGISRIKPKILQLIDLPIHQYNLKIKIRDHKYTDEIALHLISPAYFSSKSQNLLLIFDTLPS